MRKTRGTHKKFFRQKLPTLNQRDWIKHLNLMMQVQLYKCIRACKLISMCSLELVFLLDVGTLTFVWACRNIRYFKVFNRLAFQLNRAHLCRGMMRWRRTWCLWRRWPTIKGFPQKLSRLCWSSPWAFVWVRKQLWLQFSALSLVSSQACDVACRKKCSWQVWVIVQRQIYDLKVMYFLPFKSCAVSENGLTIQFSPVWEKMYCRILVDNYVIAG